MNRVLWMSCHIWLSIVLIAAGPFAAAQSAPPGTPMFEATSSALITFGGQDRLVRAAAIFAKPDSAVIQTTVVFIDAHGTVLKQVQADLSHNQPVVVELTRQDAGNRPDVLVRAVVVHKLPGVRQDGYPILVTMQPIATDGTGRSPTAWPAGRCGTTCGSPVGRGQHASCEPTFPNTF